MKKILLLVMVLLLSGCNKLEEGNIIEMEYNEPYTQLMFIPIIVSSGNSTTTMIVPFYVFHPEKWKIKIEGDYNGETRSETYYISEQRYNELNIGDFVTTDETFSTDDGSYKIKKSQVKESDFDGYTIID